MIMMKELDIGNKYKRNIQTKILINLVYFQKKITRLNGNTFGEMEFKLYVCHSNRGKLKLIINTSYNVRTQLIH